MKKIIFVFFCFICSALFVNAKQLNKDLFNAVADNDMKEVQALIEKGADVKAKDKNNLSLISYSRDKEMIEYLLSKGAEIDNINTALILGKTDLAKEMINKGFDINYQDYSKRTPLSYMAETNNFDMVKFLVKHGADVNLHKTDDKTPLHYAAQNENLKMAKFLVKYGADVNAGYDGANPLYFAVVRNDKKMMKYLISKGADVNTKLGNMSALLQASMSCNEEAIEILMKHKANTYNENIALTPIQAITMANPNECSLSKKKKILTMMIKYGADINMPTPGYGDMTLNTLDLILIQGYEPKTFIPLLKMLIELGAKNHKETDRVIIWQIKEQGSEDNKKEVIKFLLENGFDINIKDEDGKTALDYEISDNMRQFLISHGAKSGKDL